MSTITAKRLAEPSALTTSPVTKYTVPALTTTALKSLDGCNPAAAQSQLWLYIVPTGDSAVDANALVAGLIVPPNGRFWWEGEIILNAGDTLQAKSVPAGLTLTHASGVEVTA